MNKNKMFFSSLISKVGELSKQTGETAKKLANKLKNFLKRFSGEEVYKSDEEFKNAYAKLSEEEKQELENELTIFMEKLEKGEKTEISSLKERDNRGVLKRLDYNYFRNIDKIKTISPRDETGIIVIDQSDISKIDEEFLSKTRFNRILINVDYSKPGVKFEDVLKVMEINTRHKKSLGLDEIDKTEKKLRKTLVVSDSTWEEYLENNKFSFVEFSKYPHLYSAENVLSANAMIDKWVEQINSLKINGQELSPFEKYMCAYNLVTSYSNYQLDDSIWVSAGKSRNITSILNKDISNGDICCVGYARLLNAICNRLGISSVCANEGLFTSEKGMRNDSILSETPNHLTVRVYINDPKYHINGVYHSDPTNDYVRKNLDLSVNFCLENIDNVYVYNKQLNNKYFTGKYILRTASSSELAYYSNSYLKVLRGEEKCDSLSIQSTIESPVENFEGVLKFYEDIGLKATEQEINDYLASQNGLKKKQLDNPEIALKIINSMLNNKTLSDKYSKLKESFLAEPSYYNFWYYLIRKVDSFSKEIVFSESKKREKYFFKELKKYCASFKTVDDLLKEYENFQRENTAKIVLISKIKEMALRGKIDSLYDEIKHSIYSENKIERENPKTKPIDYGANKEMNFEDLKQEGKIGRGLVVGLYALYGGGQDAISKITKILSDSYRNIDIPEQEKTEEQKRLEMKYSDFQNYVLMILSRENIISKEEYERLVDKSRINDISTLPTDFNNLNQFGE